MNELSTENLILVWLIPDLAHLCLGDHVDFGNRTMDSATTSERPDCAITSAPSREYVSKSIEITGHV
jgi:hypothetical protein